MLNLCAFSFASPLRLVFCVEVLSALHAEGWDLELPEVEAPCCVGRHDFHTNLSWVGCEGGDPRVESQCLRQRLGTSGM